MRLLDLLRGRKKAFVTPSEILKIAQAESPPLTRDFDLGSAIYRRIGPRLNPATRALFENQTIAIGEIGLASPNAMAEFIAPSGYVVRVHSGLSYLFGYVTRAILRGATLRSQVDPEKTDAPVLSAEGITVAISELMRALARGEALAKPDDENLNAARFNLANRIAEAAEDFVVAHEMGHITAWRARGGDPGVIPPEEEYVADFHALHFVLGVSASIYVQDHMDRRVAYAGAELALRIFASLEHLGYPFETSHPSPGGRLAKLRETAKQLFLTPRRYLEVSTIAFAQDQQLEAIEQTLVSDDASREFILGVTKERLLSTLTAVLEELVRERMDGPAGIAQINALFQGVSEALIHETAAAAVDLYVTHGLDGAHLRNIPLRSAENQTFERAIPFLAPHLRAFFEEALEASKQPPSVDQSSLIPETDKEG